MCHLTHWHWTIVKDKKQNTKPNPTAFQIKPIEPPPPPNAPVTSSPWDSVFSSVSYRLLQKHGSTEVLLERESKLIEMPTFR